MNFLTLNDTKLKKENTLLNRITVITFVCLLLELTLGGGGRLTALGPVSLRMILFGIAMLLSGIHFLSGKKISREHLTLLVFYSLALVVGLIMGILSGAEKKFWWEDIKPLSYFYIFPFLGYAITDQQIIQQSSSILRFSGVLLSVSFLFLLFLIHTDTIPFLYFYKHIITTEEFFFRGELTFFYKGFLFLCISFLFIFFTGKYFRRSLLLLECVGIILTATRGLWFALLSTFALYYMVHLKKKTIIFIILACIVLFSGSVLIASVSKLVDVTQSMLHNKIAEDPATTLLGDRNYSDKGRFQQVREVADRVTLTSFFIGHGFGIGVPSRPVHMEISYVEIFHKQGILGLAFWFFLLYKVYQRYKKTLPGNEREAYFFSCIFIFAQSLTNQYINNPIGLSIVLLCLVCLEKLGEREQENKGIHHESVVNQLNS